MRNQSPAPGPSLRPGRARACAGGTQPTLCPHTRGKGAALGPWGRRRSRSDAWSDFRRPAALKTVEDSRPQEMSAAGSSWDTTSDLCDSARLDQPVLLQRPGRWLSLQQAHHGGGTDRRQWAPSPLRGKHLKVKTKATQRAASTQPQARILPGCKYHIQLLRSQKGRRSKVPFTSPSQMSPNLTVTPRNLSPCFLPSITDWGSGQVGPSRLGASLVQPAPRAAQSRLQKAVCSSNSRWPGSVQLGSRVLPTPRPSATAHPARVSSAAAPPRGELVRLSRHACAARPASSVGGPKAPSGC